MYDENACVHVTTSRMVKIQITRLYNIVHYSNNVIYTTVEVSKMRKPTRVIDLIPLFDRLMILLRIYACLGKLYYTMLCTRIKSMYISLRCNTYNVVNKIKLERLRWKTITSIRKRP